MGAHRVLAPSLPRVSSIAAPVMKAPLPGVRYAPSPAVVEGPTQSSLAVNATQGAAFDTLMEDNVSKSMHLYSTGISCERHRRAGDAQCVSPSRVCLW